MTPAELVADLTARVTAGDYYGAMLTMSREWARKYHPGIGKGSAVFELGDGRMMTVPITSSSATASEPAPEPLSVPRSPRS